MRKKNTIWKKMMSIALIIIAGMIILVIVQESQKYIPLYLHVKSLPYYWESSPYYWKDSDFIGKNADEIANLFPANWDDASAKEFMQCRTISPENNEVYVTLIYGITDDKGKIVVSVTNGIIHRNDKNVDTFYKKRYTNNKGQEEEIMIRIPNYPLRFKRRISF
jgi:hypothetical protein